MQQGFFLRCLAGLTVSLVAGCASLTASGPGATVDRAVAALGGDALRAVKTIEITGTARHWEPDQSYVARGDMRFAGESTFTQTRDFASGAARTDWHRKLAYPAPREYRYTETLADGLGYVAGIDATARTRQSLASNPPVHAMSRMRVVTALRELQRASPLLVLQMQAARNQLVALPDTTVGDVRLATVGYTVDGNRFQVMFDSASGLPARIRTLDYDSVQGDSTYDLVLSDWRAVGGVQLAHRQVYQLNGRDVIDTRHATVRLNPGLAAAQFEIPAAYRSVAAQPPAVVPHQWVLRRQFIGVYLDTDTVTHDPATSSGPRLQEVAPGVQLVQGVSHNSLIVEMRDHLIVFDAPISDAYSHWVLAQLKTRYPGKPVRTLVLTHHHMDHTSGTRAYMAQGAALVVGAGNAAHFRAMLGAPHGRSPDLPQAVATAAQITEVADRLVLSDGTRRVSVHTVENPHAAATLIGYVEDARLGFVTDLWSPGRDPLGQRLNPGQAALVAGVTKAGITPERFAGGHGSTAGYAGLAALAGK